MISGRNEYVVAEWFVYLDDWNDEESEQHDMIVSIYFEAVVTEIKNNLFQQNLI